VPLNKYANRRDANEAEIVKALEAIGCTVFRLDRPVDLLVGYRGYTFCLEVKQRGRENRKDQQAQRDWMKGWKGHVRIVFSPEEAISLVTEAYGRQG